MLEHVDVTDVAGGAERSAMDPPVGDDAAADAGAHLDEQHVGDSRHADQCSPSAMMFTSLSTSVGASNWSASLRATG